MHLEAKVQNISAHLQFEGVIGHKAGCQYSDLPHFVREVAEFKSDSDVVINHIADTRIELRVKEIFKKMEESEKRIESQM